MVTCIHHQLINFLVHSTYCYMLDRILSLLTRSVKYWLPPSMFWGITIFTHFDVRVCQKVPFFKVSKICQKLLWKSLTLFFVCKAPIFSKNLKGMHIYGKLRYIRFTCKQDLGPNSPGKNTVSSWSLSKNGFSNMH